MMRARIALTAGLAYYDRRRGMAIADRDGEGFEIVYGEVNDARADVSALEVGKVLFERLRLRPYDVRTLPLDGEELSAEADDLLSP
jgi:hypothetical protein